MEERFNKLDNFLRERLHDASENHAWNVPDDAIFEKAMRTVAEGKKKKRRAWVLIPLLLAGGLLISEYLHNRQIETLESKITTLEDNLSRESSSGDPLTSTPSNLEEGSSSQQATTSAGTQGLNATASPNETTSSSEQKRSADVASSTASGSASGGTTSKAKSLEKASTKATPAAAQTDGTRGLPTKGASTTNKTKTNPITQSTGSEKPTSADPSKTTVAEPLTSQESIAGVMPEAAGTAGIPLAGNWVTDPLSSLAPNNLAIEERQMLILPSIAAPIVQVKSPPVYAMQYGLLLGVNQSWLTMKNIPPAMDAHLYAYDNSHPGFSMNAFVNKPVSPKFSLQGGLGYHVYNNRSVLEDQFLFDSGNVMQMPNGDNMYQTDYELVNPIGGYNMLLEFRVSDEMHQNDVVVEYTTIEQQIQSVMLDLGVHYNLVTLNDFKISLGTGLGLGYMASLKNEFNVATYHNGILQENQMERPDHLDSVNKWYLQWLGNINVGYYPSRRFGIILATQYNAGLTSIRNGGSANGPLTFLHAFSISAGVTHSF